MYYKQVYVDKQFAYVNKTNGRQARSLVSQNCQVKVSLM